MYFLHRSCEMRRFCHEMVGVLLAYRIRNRKTKALTPKDVHFIFFFWFRCHLRFCLYIFFLLLTIYNSGRSFVFLCSRFDYYVLQQQLNNTLHRPVGLKKILSNFFSPFSFPFFPFAQQKNIEKPRAE